MARQLTTLKEIVELIESSTEGMEQVTVGTVVEKLGSRSFGPILLLVGLATLAPLPSGIPGVPTTMGALTMLIAIQLLLRRNHLWLPDFIARRSLNRKYVSKGISWTRPVVRLIDWMTRRRLMIFIGSRGVLVIAIVCLFVAFTMPFMEFIPFSANIAGITITLFGLALTAHDGLFAMLGLIFISFVVGAGAFIIPRIPYPF